MRHRSDISRDLWSDEKPGPQQSEHAHPAGEDEAALAAEPRGAHHAAADPAPTAGGAGRAEAQLGQTEAGNSPRLLNMPDEQPPTVGAIGGLGL